MTSSSRRASLPPDPESAVSLARAVLGQVTGSMAQWDHLLGGDLASRVLGRSTDLQDDLYAMVSVASAVRINADAVPQSLRAFLAGGAPTQR